jgi:aldehyde dehydrogenase (NAD+)
MAQSVKITIPSSGKKISVPTGLFINNEFVPSVDSQELIESVDLAIRFRFCILILLDSAINPATEEVICQVVAGASAVDTSHLKT